MQVELLTERSTSNPTETAIFAARGDYMSDSLVDTSYEDVMETTDKDKREFVETAIQRGHWGIFEHPTAFFAVEGVSRVTMAQLTRHRHLSFDVQSMRYVDFSDKEPIVPPTFEEDGEAATVLEAAFRKSIDRYEDAIAKGIPKEDARFFLPLATPVNLTFSGNIRTLLHVLDLRKSGAAQHEIRELAERISDELRDWCPIIVEEYEEHAANSSLQSP